MLQPSTWFLCCSIFDWDISQNRDKCLSTGNFHSDVFSPLSFFQASFQKENEGFIPKLLCLWVWPCETSPFCVRVSIGTVLAKVLFRGSCCCDLSCEAALSFLGVTISQQISWSSGSSKLSVPFLKGSLSLCC